MGDMGKESVIIVAGLTRVKNQSVEINDLHQIPLPLLTNCEVYELESKGD